MKIGDKVRFLREKGGGKVVGFQGKNIVLVEDEDGFDIPYAINEVVVVGNDDYSTKKIIETKNEPHEADSRSIKERLNATSVEEEEESETDPADTYVAPPMEREGGNLLSVYIAYVPIDTNNFNNTSFETYIVNDSNYSIYYNYMTAEGAIWTLRSSGEVEPNTKEYIEEIKREQLNDMTHLCVQLIAAKKEKPFQLKPSVDVQYRLDPVKFYKQNSFLENDFFEQPALLCPIIENDIATHPLVLDAKKLKKEMFSSKSQEDNLPGKVDSLVRRYEKEQSKSRQIRQQRQDDKIVVDLHADAVLETTSGMSSTDILNYQMDVFRKTLQQYKSSKGQKIVFIHGKGEGVLRQNIINELKYRYKNYTYQDASFLEYGYGATQVTIR